LKVIILGAGKIGSVIAFYLTKNKVFDEVSILDQCRDQFECFSQIKYIVQDIENEIKLKEIISNYQLVITAIPWKETLSVLHISAKLKIPFITITRPNYADFEILKKKLKNNKTPIIIGCGLEPGLTEIITRNIARKFSVVHEFHIKCGGIPLSPNPPMNYKVVFGNDCLPIGMRNAYFFENGALKTALRFSGVEKINVDLIGELEAWHDGMLPYFSTCEEFSSLTNATQKTLRWPGFSEKVNFLNELGFLSNEPINIGGLTTTPRNCLDAVLYPHVKFKTNDRDITLLLIEVKGLMKGKKTLIRFTLINHFDEENKITAMGKATGYTAGIIANMIADGSLTYEGLCSPDEAINGLIYENLLAKLLQEGIVFNETREDIT